MEYRDEARRILGEHLRKAKVDALRDVDEMENTGMIVNIRGYIASMDVSVP